jgi:hypothetical protein
MAGWMLKKRVGTAVDKEERKGEKGYDSTIKRAAYFSGYTEHAARRCE